MTRKKLKDWVIPTLGIIVLCGALLLYYILGNIINHNLVTDNTLITNPIINNVQEVQGEAEEPKQIVKPYTDSSVIISKYYYQASDEESRQEQSLIKYENIYMPNTGILYSSTSEFKVIAVLEGKVTSVKTDDILGNIVEIEHDNGLISIYQSVKDVKVNVGDTVVQGDVIATSGPNKLENESENCLHFETYKDGSLINPEDFYNIEIS